LWNTTNIKELQLEYNSTDYLHTFTNLEHITYRTQPKMYKILKQISKDVKETARIQENIDENVFLRYYEKLWNTTNINELQLEYNSTD
jgi:hypothetical protein